MIWISAYDMDIRLRYIISGYDHIRLRYVISGDDIPTRQNTPILTQTAPHMQDINQQKGRFQKTVLLSSIVVTEGDVPAQSWSNRWKGTRYAFLVN